MTQHKKYDLRVIEGPAGWSTEIIRRASAKKTVVSKQQAGFATESEARAWGETELKAFLKGLAEKNQREAKRD